MASCAQIESLAQAYVDGELGPSETLLFEQHLGECQQCARTLEYQRATSEALFAAFAEHRMQGTLVSNIMAHLPEMDDSRLVRQMNQRAKYRPSRARLFLTILTPLATVVLLMLSLAIFLSWPTPTTTVAQSIGMITYTTGDVQSLLPNETHLQNVRLQDPVGRDQVFESAEESAAIIGLAGPSTVKVAAGTRVKTGDDRRVDLQTGKIWLHVAKSMGGTRAFRVHTPDGNITVFGTTFGVEVREGHTIVTLLEGEVTVENDISFVVLRANQEVELRQGVSPLTAYDVNAREILAWADRIQPDGVTQAAFVSSVRPMGETILRAENVWHVDTGDHAVSTMSVAWKTHGSSENLCSYVVYVTNESGEPLFVGRVAARDLGQPGRTKAEIPVPGDALRPHTAVFVRLVPDTKTGSIESEFTEVAFVGVQP